MLSLFATVVRDLLHLVLRWPFARRALHELSHANMRINDNALLKSFRSCGSNVTIHMPVTIVTPECVEVGANVSIAHYVHIWGAGGLIIGDDVMIGTHTSISTVTHDYSVEDAPMSSTLILKPVVIESDVWIGSNAVILPGVRIGNGAVIGAGCVVTRDVGAMEIVVGVPGRVIRKRGEET